MSTIPDVIDVVLSRASALGLAEPGPTAEHLDLVLRAGTRAPDHGKLQPWRFMIFEGDGRKRLGAAMADALRAENATVDSAELEREAQKPMRAPAVVSVGVKIVPGKIPEIEQQLAAAAAVQNMILVSQALGYGSMWKTGSPAYSESIKKFLGLEPSDAIVGFLYFGTASAMPKNVRETELLSLISRG